MIYRPGCENTIKISVGVEKRTIKIQARMGVLRISTRFYEYPKILVRIGAVHDVGSKDVEAFVQPSQKQAPRQDRDFSCYF